MWIEWIEVTADTAVTLPIVNPIYVTASDGTLVAGIWSKSASN